MCSATSKLISHSEAETTIENCVKKIEARLRQEGDKPYASLDYQLELLHQLRQSNFGCFLLQNGGVNGYWTDYMLMHPERGRKTGVDVKGKKIPAMESFILDRSPILLATQQRMQIFLRENQKSVKNGAVLACIPCGMMGELLYLNYTDINDIRLVGTDYDSNVFSDALWLAEKQGLAPFVSLKQGDAWQLNIKNEFDLISSNGLTIYEPEPIRIRRLYHLYYDALKVDGKLVTSFLTAPPAEGTACEWDFAKINRDDLLLQKILFVDILHVKFQCYSSTEQTRQQLEEVGFRDIEFIYDEARIFPTVVAYK